MTTWAVTMRTGPNRWTTIEIEAEHHEDAIDEARRLIGGTFSEIV